MIISRHLDELNRIVLPHEVVSKFDWSTKTQIDLEVTPEQSVILTAHRPACKICGSTEVTLIPVKETFLCRTCLDAANSIINQK